MPREHPGMDQVAEGRVLRAGAGDSAPDPGEERRELSLGLDRAESLGDRALLKALRELERRPRLGGFIGFAGKKLLPDRRDDAFGAPERLEKAVLFRGLRAQLALELEAQARIFLF